MKIAVRRVKDRHFPEHVFQFTDCGFPQFIGDFAARDRVSGEKQIEDGAAVFAECVELGVQCFNVEQGIFYGVGYDGFAHV